MSIISRNCQDFGQIRAVLILRELVRVHKIEVPFLFETLVSANKIEEIKWMLGFDYYFVVDRIGRSGGLCVF